jgi:hypothetical protein
MARARLPPPRRGLGRPFGAAAGPSGSSVGAGGGFYALAFGSHVLGGPRLEDTLLSSRRSRQKGLSSHSAHLGGGSWGLSSHSDPCPGCLGPFACAAAGAKIGSLRSPSPSEIRYY